MTTGISYLTYAPTLVVLLFVESRTVRIYRFVLDSSQPGKELDLESEVNTKSGQLYAGGDLLNSEYNSCRGNPVPRASLFELAFILLFSFFLNHFLACIFPQLSALALRGATFSSDF
jgi:hypothetical protein